MNVPIESWFRRWSAEHYTLCRASRVPKPDSEEGQAFFALVLKAFAARRVTEEAARAATERVVMDPPPFRRHAHALIQHAVEAMRAAGGEPTALPIDDTREAAEFASKGCPHCSGSTFARVRLRETPERPCVSETGAYCVCRFGRWLRTNHARSCPDVFRRIPDYAEVLAGRSAWEPAHETEESIAAL